MTFFLAVADPPWDADAGGGGRGAQNHYALAGVDQIAAAMRTAPPWVDTGPGLLWLWATSRAFIEGDVHVLARALGFRPCAGWVWCKVDAVEAVEVPDLYGPVRGFVNDIHDCLDSSGGVDMSFTTGLMRLISPMHMKAMRIVEQMKRAMLYRAPARMGLGQWQRCEHEHLILCRRGDVAVPAPAARERSVIYAPRGEHSVKPAEAWAVIEGTSASSIKQTWQHSYEGAGISELVRLGVDVVGVEYFARARRERWSAWGTLDGPHTPPRFEAGGAP